MSYKPTGIPLKPDGEYDKEAIRAMFMSSKYLDWTRFAEDQGWEPLRTRLLFPVKTWIKEKRDTLTEKQMDILSGLIHERKFTWTHEIIKTLDEYPAAIDMGMSITKAKMSQMADMFRDYQDNFIGKTEKMYRTTEKGRKIRVFHPFERMKPGEVGALMSGIKALTDAKLKALMLDKWAISKLDLPVEQDQVAEGESTFGPRITIEGRELVDSKDLQKWFDNYHDKPQIPAAEVNAENQTTIVIEESEAPDGGS